MKGTSLSLLTHHVHVKCCYKLNDVRTEHIVVIRTCIDGYNKRSVLKSVTIIVLYCKIPLVFFISGLRIIILQIMAIYKIL